MTSSSLSASPDYSVAAAQILNVTKKKFQPVPIHSRLCCAAVGCSWMGGFATAAQLFVRRSWVSLFWSSVPRFQVRTHAQDELAAFKQTLRKYADVCLKTWVVQQCWPLVRVSGMSGPTVELQCSVYSRTLHKELLWCLCWTPQTSH